MPSSILTGKWTVSSRLGLAQDLAQAGVQVEPVSGEVKLLLGHVPRVNGRRDSFGRHRGGDPPGGVMTAGRNQGAGKRGAVYTRGSPPLSVPLVTNLDHSVGQPAQPPRPRATTP